MPDVDERILTPTDDKVLVSTTETAFEVEMSVTVAGVFPQKGQAVILNAPQLQFLRSRSGVSDTGSK